MITKSLLRTRILNKREKMRAPEIREKSTQIARSLLELEDFSKFSCANIYVSKRKEVDTSKIIKRLLSMDKTVTVPVITNGSISPCRITRKTSFVKGLFGIPVPDKMRAFDGRRLEVCVVPGLSFDLNGYRLGYGKGYYDRFLRNKNVIKIGLAFEWQIVQKLSHNAHDVKMDYVITENRIVRCKP